MEEEDMEEEDMEVQEEAFKKLCRTENCTKPNREINEVSILLVDN